MWSFQLPIAGIIINIKSEVLMLQNCLYLCQNNQMIRYWAYNGGILALFINEIKCVELFGENYNYKTYISDQPLIRKDNFYGAME